ncbi:MAG: response regulator [Pseudomonadota bacterium]
MTSTDSTSNNKKLSAQDPVLVVEDDFVSRELNVNLLWEVGFSNVLTANDGMRALSVFKEQQAKNHPIKLIVCDWNMPQMNGLDLLEIMRKDESLNTIPFFLVSSNHNKAHIIKAIKAGVTGYVVKPVSLGQLKDKLTAYLP